MCENRNISLKWDFSTFSAAAHHSSTGIKEAIYTQFPELKIQEPNWEVLYAEKKQILLELIKEGQTQLMEGAEPLLKALAHAAIPSCVVTNSPFLFIELIRQQLPILNLIPYWVTREHYSKPKPHCECYEYAIKKHAKSTDKIIGFEDSPKGFSALKQTRALPVLICANHFSYLNHFDLNQLHYYPSFKKINEKNYPSCRTLRKLEQVL